MRNNDSVSGALGVELPGEGEGGAVGPYRAPNRFAGIIEGVTVEID